MSLKQLGFRSRLFLILALFALVPSVVLTAVWGGTMAGLLPRMSGAAAWDSVAETGARALSVARRQPRTAKGEQLLAEHERELATSVTRARQFEYLIGRLVPVLLVVGLGILAALAFLASRAAGHLSRQASRPLDELVGWTERIRLGEPLPERAEGRGAPEFEVLRSGMRQMAADLDAGRRVALEKERLEAFRESARQVAHELKNPLTPIRFAVEQLKRKVGPELSEVVEVLSVESARLESMARSFAQFGRLPEGPEAELDVAELVRDVARTAVPLTMECSVEAGPDVPLLRGQHDALGRALSNVLLNAVDACAGQGRIVVRVAMTAAWEVVVSVHDSGPGIPRERLGTIWDPYVTSKTGGTGLGLAIVKQTVKAHGGRAEAHSSPGNGTEIRLILPVRRSDPAETT